MNKQFILRAFPDTYQDHFITTALLVIAFFVALLGAWAAFAVVPEIAKTRGEVIPQGGDIQMVQSLSGGKLLQVFVQEGDVVEKGQPIASLDQSVSEADIRKLDVQHADLTMRIERLRALEQDREPHFGAEGQQFPSMAAEQNVLYKSQLQLMNAQLEVIDDQISEKQTQLTSIKGQARAMEEQLQTVMNEVTMFEKAAEKGLSSKRELLEKQEKLSELRRSREDLSGSREIAIKNLETLRDQRVSKQREIKNEYRLRRAEHVEKLNEVEQELIQAHSSIGQNALTAPAAGIIKSMPNAKVGAVLQPGGVVAELVPSNQPLNVEVRVSPRDIGFIAVGQKVLIKVDAYDYSRFGAIKGEVVRVSPSTFKDEQTGQPYFKATIQPESEYVGEPARGRRIKVGMTAEADITTGKKTVFQYLLKPVYTTVDTALSER